MSKKIGKRKQSAAGRLDTPPKNDAIIIIIILLSYSYSPYSIYSEYRGFFWGVGWGVLPSILRLAFFLLLIYPSYPYLIIILLVVVVCSTLTKYYEYEPQPCCFHIYMRSSSLASLSYVYIHFYYPSPSFL